MRQGERPEDKIVKNVLQRLLGAVLLQRFQPIQFWLQKIITSAVILKNGLSFCKYYLFLMCKIKKQKRKQKKQQIK
jgi:hypothetical protein